MRDKTKDFFEILETFEMPEEEICYLIDEAGVKSEVLQKHYTPQELADELQDHDNYLKLFDEDDIAAHVDVKSLITSGNVNLVIRDLVLSDPSIATQVLDELLYWRNTAERI